MVEKLESLQNYVPPRGPVMLVIMDGMAISPYEDGNAVEAASTPTLDWLYANCPWTKLKAHGTAVGLPSDKDMGNSEVGHNAIGAGRVYEQGAALVNSSIASGDMFQRETWQKLVKNVTDNDSVLHFIGLFSDGNVHSHLDHLKAMIQRAKDEGVKKVRIHALLDGRDVGETSALEYIDPFEEFLAELNASGNFDARIASGGGRMVITMDRYEADWGMVEKGWKIHVHGEGRQFASAREAVETLREETGAIDQDLPPFVIAENGDPVGPVRDNDSVIFFNFRGDRALEITAAFEQDEFEYFDREPRPDVMYAGMMEYDGDMHVPANYLVVPPRIDRTVGEFVAAAGLSTLALSEVQKFGHVTYFYNGNKTGKVHDGLEEYVQIQSDQVPFEQRPWMQAAPITDYVIDDMENGRSHFIRLNYANGDMVGHTGIFQAAEIAVETVDLCLGRLCRAAERSGAVMVITADHGNSDDMYMRDKSGNVQYHPDGKPKMKTAHSLNPVPCIIYDPEGGKHGRKIETLKSGLGISSLAATTLNLLGLQKPADYDPSVVDVG